MSRKTGLEELEGYAKKASLSSSNAAMLLLALTQYNVARPLCESLVIKVRGKGIVWLKKNKLSEVVLRLLALQSYRKTSITGPMLAILAKRLMESEVQIGGPYHSSTNDDFVLNALIAQLFESFGSPLTSLNKYLEEAILTDPRHLATNFGIWSVSMPNKLALDIKTPRYNIHSARSGSIQERVATVSLLQRGRQVVAKHSSELGEEIIQSIKSEIKTMSPLVQQDALELWKSVIKIDHRYEITCLSWYFARCLNKSLAIYSKEQYVDLGAANFYAWIAYTIYDNIIDDEDTERLLPLANICHRLSLFRYLKFANESFIKKFYDDVDLASAYELIGYRASVHAGLIDIDSIPEYGNREFLAQRSRGHVLGPLIITAQTNGIKKSQQLHIQSALDHYLIARQLNDDAHDWVKDLLNGQMSFVVARLLTKTHTVPGRYEIKQLTSTLQGYFQSHGLDEISELTISHVHLAKKHLQESGIINMDSVFVERFIDQIESSALEAKRQLAEQKKFVSTYARK